MSQLPSGWRCTVRALQGWMVEVIRQLCDILSWCLAVWAPRGPFSPHIYSSPLENTWGHTSSDDELVAVDHKKNIRAMSHKEKKEKWKKGGEKGGGWRWGEKRALRTGWLRRKCEREIRAEDRIKKSMAKNKAKRDGGSEREIVRFGPNGSSTAPAVTIKQQVDAIIRAWQIKQESQSPSSLDASLLAPGTRPR